MFKASEIDASGGFEKMVPFELNGKQKLLVGFGLVCYCKACVSNKLKYEIFVMHKDIRNIH